MKKIIKLHCCGDITISDYYFFGDITFAPKSDFADKVIFRISKAEAGLLLALSGALPANERAVRILEIWIFQSHFWSVVLGNYSRWHTNFVFGSTG